MKSRSYPNVTANKTSTIEGLKLQVRDQSTVVAEAEAKYNSLNEKLATFNTLLTQATTDLNTAQANNNQYLTVDGDINATNKAAATSSEVSQSTYGLSKKMLSAWEDVAEQTLDAATQIAQVTEYIQKRKAANPIISTDLVNDAVAANKNAATVVKMVIAALTDAMDALTSAGEASQSTDLTMLYAEMGANYATGSGTGTTAAESSHAPLGLPMQILFSAALEQAKQDVNSYNAAVQKVTQQTADAQKEYSEAQEQLDALEAALAAAETAIAG